MNETVPKIIPAAKSKSHENNMNIPVLTLQHQCLYLQDTTPEKMDVITAKKDPHKRMMNEMFLYFEKTFISSCLNPLKLK